MEHRVDRSKKALRRHRNMLRSSKGIIKMRKSKMALGGPREILRSCAGYQFFGWSKRFWTGISEKDLGEI